MAKSSRKVLVLAKIQVAAGVPAVPTVAENAILVRNPNPNPVVTESVDRALLRPYFGNSEQLPGLIHSEIDFEVELAGSGTPGVAPAWGPLLRACAFAQTVTDDVDVKYRPITDNLESLTLHYNLDGVLHQLTDCVGTVSFDLTAKGIPIMKFHFIGTYNPVTDSPVPGAVDYSKFLTPRTVNKTNTPTWSMHDYTGCLQSLQVDMANQLVYRGLVGCEGPRLTDRKPTGSAVFELGSVASKNWWAAVEAGTSAPLTITHGVEAGNIIVFDAPKVQLTGLQYSDQDSIAMLTSALTINPDQGNDEFVITVK